MVGTDDSFDAAVEEYKANNNVSDANVTFKRIDEVVVVERAESRLVLDITPYMVVITEGEVAPVKEKLELKSTAVTVTLNVGSWFADGDVVSVSHKTEAGTKEHVAVAAVADGFITFVTDKGFSEYILEAAEVILTTETDSGYYAEAKDGEAVRGEVAFRSFFENYADFDITHYGMYVYTTADNQAELQNGEISTLIEAKGYFTGSVTGIPVEGFDAMIYAKPYVVVNGKTYYGDTISTTVNSATETLKWLGGIQ